MIPFQYAYLTGNLIFFLLWIFFFIRRKDLRKEMLVMSLLVAPLGPLSEFWYIRDYWKPELFMGGVWGFEDTWFAFSAGGIGGVIYEEIMGRRIIKRHLRRHNWLLGVFAAIALLTLILLNNILRINSIYASSIAFLIPATIIVLTRKDLVWDAILSGIFLSLSAFFSYQIFIFLFPGIIERWWMLHNISGILVARVPLEELLWFFSWGMLIGPLYEFIIGLNLERLPAQKR